MQAVGCKLWGALPTTDQESAHKRVSMKQPRLLEPSTLMADMHRLLSVLLGQTNCADRPPCRDTGRVAHLIDHAAVEQR